MTPTVALYNITERHYLSISSSLQSRSYNFLPLIFHYQTKQMLFLLYLFSTLLKRKPKLELKMGVAEGIGGGATIIDETYEFFTTGFFDFTKEESDGDIRRAELWFHNALSYAPSPFMPKIKAGRSVTVNTLCDFSEADNMEKMSVKVEDRALESNTQQVSITSNIKEDDKAKEEKLTTVARVISMKQLQVKAVNAFIEQ